MMENDTFVVLFSILRGPGIPPDMSVVVNTCPPHEIRILRTLHCVVHLLFLLEMY